MKINRLFLLGISVLVLTLFSNCAYINLPLIDSAMPLDEQILEGEGKKKILLLDISGTISDKQSDGLGFSDKLSLVTTIKESLKKAEDDKRIAGIILRINSPGGTVTGSDIIYHELIAYKAKTNTPIYACMMDVAASGGYYIAIAADKIYAHPTTITGSIGVIAMKLDLQGLLQKIGVKNETIKSGDKKDIMSFLRPSTPEETAILQEIINSLYHKFVDAIYLQRKDKLTRQQILALADGRIYSAQQALNNKLIDQIGYLDDAIQAMKSDLNLKDAKVISYYRPGAYKNNIYSETPPLQPSVISINGAGLEAFEGLHFMYLWNP